MLGDELYVIISRDVNVNHKPTPIIPENQRRMMVAALKPVDFALLGSLTDYFEPISEINPDIVVLGFDQKFQEKELEDALNERGFFPKVIRLSKADSNGEGEFYSSRRIAAEIIERKNKNQEID
ncbi:hypothetical protein MmiHf6_05230 [Methanimicrococcus hongohii]|uniref:Cytidyltransferase-like domain-containing protein n=2 Tax=Methanimicrococcus hongohii TaxID=3028295 RepID=A0AA96UZZ0_9EURY|nr:hypothetical protein MmiHf6_05230 [Methanimicrococcus sp. Hf6]